MNKVRITWVDFRIENLHVSNCKLRHLALATIIGSTLLLASCATSDGDIASWPVTNAEKSAITGTVVDVLCELGGTCSENCGEGKRQLAIKTDGGGTVLVSKNLTNYSGAADELWPFCGEIVEVNGLFTEHKGVRFFQAQNLRRPGEAWQKATGYLQAWSDRSGKPLSLATDWQYNDDRVKQIIDRDGRLGLGQAADVDFFE